MQKSNKTACQKWQAWVQGRHVRAIQTLNPASTENNDEQNIKNENDASRSPKSTTRNRAHRMTVAHGMHLPSYINVQSNQSMLIRALGTVHSPSCKVLWALKGELLKRSRNDTALRQTAAVSGIAAEWE